SGTARPLVLGMDPEKGGGGCVRGRRRLDGKGGVELGERRDRHYVSPSDDGPDGRAKAPGPGDRIDHPGGVRDGDPGHPGKPAAGRGATPVSRTTAGRGTKIEGAGSGGEGVGLRTETGGCPRRGAGHRVCDPGGAGPDSPDYRRRTARGAEGRGV